MLLNLDFGGDVATDKKTLDTYSRDASSFRRVPTRIYYPKSTADIVTLLGQLESEKKTSPVVSLTVRAGGTCMSGGSLTRSWVLDMTRYMNQVTIDPEAGTATVEAGAYFRDIEDAASAHGLMFAAYPSSHRLCGIGGMLGNNASGEKSLRYGPTSANVLELEVILADGTVTRIAPKEIAAANADREKVLLDLYTKHGAALRDAVGNVTKAASGYALHKLVDGDMFNEVPLWIGSQGTLGIITKAVLKLVPRPEHTDLILISAQSLDDLAPIMDIVFAHNPEGLETFDRNTYAQAKLHLTHAAEKVAPYIDQNAELFILAQFSEATVDETCDQSSQCCNELKARGFFVERVIDPHHVTAAWQIRQNSFTLMRDYNPSHHKAVPCIEDVIVPRTAMGEFIAGLDQILKHRCVSYGFHGHIGDGSFRVIPIFDFNSRTLADDIIVLMREVFALVKRLRGNFSADHGDGIVRSPFLREFYGEELFQVFEQIKELYDPNHLLNPQKKTSATVSGLADSLDLT